MSADNQINLSKKLVSLIGIASTGIFLSLPALALTNSSVNSANSNARGRDLLAQNTSGAGATGTNGTGVGQQNNSGFGTNSTGVNQPNNGGFGTNGTGVNQPNNGGFGTNGTGVNQPNNGGFGTNGTGINQPNNGGTGAGQTGVRGTTPGNQQSNVQQGSFEQLMRFGYAATQQRDYSTALSYFQRANQLRPGNPYATRAIRNVSGYIQRDAQGGTSNAPTNQGIR